ncbi:Serine/threonine-protein kinase VRK1 [Bagarius yarrelli]|uniref:non-specific serine/threonine protein kinase n=1 Tax=Bagarius yarrelli TaxID=175774 RepID=A0A556V5I5_BAGYA|nr:Serine/threonine-protein kinase VRK1 [Bagarius yarrelli]
MEGASFIFGLDGFAANTLAAERRQKRPFNLYPFDSDRHSNDKKMPPKAKAAGKARGPAKRKLAEEFPPGEVLTDTAKKSWKLGKPVGQGGFGLLYLANDNTSKAVGDDAPFVIKVEPSDNGPLFSELKFYMRAAKPDLIGAWVKSRKLKYLGVPKYWGSGLHEKEGKRYRFMVMDRFGTDLQKKFEESQKKFPRKLVLQLGLRLLDILEYIHEHEYVHADIKASNLLLSHKNPNQVYLVDYGLAYRFSPDAPSRRGDLEILGYCMIQWLCSRLPWEDKLQDPVYVRDAKIRCRNNLKDFMKSCFTAGQEPEEMMKYMEEVKKLGYTDKPDYAKLRSILQQGLKSISTTDDDKLDFAALVSGAGPSSVRVLSACVYSPLMYHKFADTVTSERAQCRQSAHTLATREATDSPRLPTMPFAYGRCHQGAGPCQLRVTCPLQLLYVIIEPICSAQQGLNGNHEVAIGEMEGERKKKNRERRDDASEKEESSDETDSSPAKKRRPSQKKETKVAKKSAAKKSSPKKRLVKSGTQTSPAVEAKRGRGRPKKTA